MGTPLTDWGYKRLRYQRTGTTYYDEHGAAHTSWGSWSFAAVAVDAHPSQMYVGAHSATQSTQPGNTWAKTTVDYPWFKVALPASTSGKTVTINFEASSSTKTVALRRITSAISGDGVPANTETNQVTKSISASGGTYTFDISTLLADLATYGNHGLLLTGTDSATSSYNKCFLTSNVTWNWESGTATTPTYSAASVDMGSAVSITLANPDASATHTLTYTFGTATGTIATAQGNGTFSWTPPLTLASEIPSTTQAWASVSCVTSIGGTAVGTTTTSIKLKVPGTVKCTVTGATLTEYVSTIATNFGVFVQGKSRITVGVATSTATAYGATVTAYSVSINDGTLTGNNKTTSYLRNSGTNNYTVTITDSRGRQSQFTDSFYVYEYHTPTVRIISAERNPATPTTIAVKHTWDISPINNLNTKNKKLFLNSTQKRNDTPSVYASTTTNNITGTNVNSAYVVKEVVTDFFTSTEFKANVAPVGGIDLDIGPDGSIGLGMEAQSAHALDVGIDAVFHGTVTLADAGLTPGRAIGIDANGKIISL